MYGTVYFTFYNDHYLIWSNDERLKAQTKVNILNTENVAKLAGII